MFLNVIPEFQSLSWIQFTPDSHLVRRDWGKNGLNSKSFVPESNKTQLYGGMQYLQLRNLIEKLSFRAVRKKKPNQKSITASGERTTFQ